MKKKSTKESDAKWMRRINDLIVDRLNIKPFTPGQINSLVFGSKKFKVIGFGSYEALIIAINIIPDIQKVKNKYVYLKVLANSDEFINECNKKIDSVKPLSDVTSLGDIMKNL